MTYEINYNHLPEGQLKRDKAIKDINNYCNPRQFDIIQAIAMSATKYRELSFICSFAGIEGYPVVALWDETRQIMHDMTN